MKTIKGENLLVELRCDECDCKYQGIPGISQFCDRCLRDKISNEKNILDILNKLKK